MSELENIIGSIMSSPESIGKVMDIVKMFGNDEKKEEQEMPPAPNMDTMGNGLGVDPEMFSKIIELSKEYNADDRRIKLLGAIRPYLKSEDSFHIDRAIQIVKLSHVAKGVLGNFLK